MYASSRRGSPHTMGLLSSLLFPLCCLHDGDNGNNNDDGDSGSDRRQRHHLAMWGGVRGFVIAQVGILAAALVLLPGPSSSRAAGVRAPQLQLYTVVDLVAGAGAGAGGGGGDRGSDGDDDEDDDAGNHNSNTTFPAAAAAAARLAKKHRHQQQQQQHPPPPRTTTATVSVDEIDGTAAFLAASALLAAFGFATPPPRQQAADGTDSRPYTADELNARSSWDGTFWLAVLAGHACAVARVCSPVDWYFLVMQSAGLTLMLFLITRTSLTVGPDGRQPRSTASVLIAILCALVFALSAPARDRGRASWLAALVWIDAMLIVGHTFDAQPVMMTVVNCRLAAAAALGALLLAMCVGGGGGGA